MALHLTHQVEPRFVVYHCDFNDDPCQRVAEYENVADVLTCKPHFDQHLKVRMGSKYFEWPDFVGGRGCRRVNEAARGSCQ